VLAVARSLNIHPSCTAARGTLPLPGMAYIHTSGGFVIRVTAGREAIVMALKAPRNSDIVEFETEGHGSHPIKVSVNLDEVVAITEEPLPPSQF